MSCLDATLLIKIEPPSCTHFLPYSPPTSHPAPEHTCPCSKMTEPKNSDIQYKPLHPTFAAEAGGVDLTKPTPELVAAIKDGLAKVRRSLPLSVGVLMDSTVS